MDSSRRRALTTTSSIASPGDARGPYGFIFPQPATGAVEVLWVANHGITDLAANSNRFARGRYTYTLDTNWFSGVRINQFMAANHLDTVVDEEGRTSDWVGLYSTNAVAVNLDGWFFTDKADQLAKWRCPSTNLPAGAYLVVFASEKDRRVPGQPLHTNFKLSTGGEYLGLIQPDGSNVVSQFAPLFPPQVTDVSYGEPSLPGQ